MNEQQVLSAAGRSRAHALRTRQGERGYVLIWAVITVMLIGGLIMASSTKVRAINDLSSVEWQARGHVYEIARAGIADAFAWMRRQSVQPVVAFEPQRTGLVRPDHLQVPTGGWATTIVADPDPEDQLNETDEPDTGLVRAYEISDGLWAKYTVRKAIPGEPFIDDSPQDGAYTMGEEFRDDDLNGKWSPPSGCRDLTQLRALNGSGASWHIESEGEIFIRPDESQPLGVGPNRRLAHTVLAQEVRRVGITLPGQAAIAADQGNRVHIKNRARIRGNGGASIIYPESSGLPLIVNPADVQGTVTSVPDYRGSVEDVFSVQFDELRSMADVSTSEPQTGIPHTIGDYQLVVAEGDVDFRVDRPLRGLGVLVVRGDVQIMSGANAFFSGLLFVDGNVKVWAPTMIRGMIVTTGDIEVIGTGGDYSEVESDPDLLQDVIRLLGQYRISKSPYRPGRDPTLFGAGEWVPAGYYWQGGGVGQGEVDNAMGGGRGWSHSEGGVTSAAGAWTSGGGTGSGSGSGGPVGSTGGQVRGGTGDQWGDNFGDGPTGP